MYDKIIELISNVGFPIVVTLYLLVRIEDKLDELTKAFNNLTKAIEKLVENPKDKETFLK